jgi:hypothetical protein
MLLPPVGAACAGYKRTGAGATLLGAVSLAIASVDKFSDVASALAVPIIAAWFAIWSEDRRASSDSVIGGNLAFVFLFVLRRANIGLDLFLLLILMLAVRLARTLRLRTSTAAWSGALTTASVWMVLLSEHA